MSYDEWGCVVLGWMMSIYGGFNIIININIIIINITEANRLRKYGVASVNGYEFRNEALDDDGNVKFNHHFSTLPSINASVKFDERSLIVPLHHVYLPSLVVVSC
jgi:hypothetical protein